MSHRQMWPGRWRLYLVDVVAQGALSIRARRLRTTLTILGTALGIATAVATLGITASAANALSERFDALRATSVSVRYPQGQPPPPLAAIDRAQGLNGVQHAGVMCASQQQHVIQRTQAIAENAQSVAVVAVQESTFFALGATLESGRWLDDGHIERRDAVALLDSVAARNLGIESVTDQPVVYVDGRPTLVIGIFAAPLAEPRLTRSVAVPYSACTTNSVTFDPPEVIVRTQLGAADQVAGEVPYALLPENPNALAIGVPPDLRTLREGVDADTRSLFLGLAGVSLLIAGLGTSNTTYVAVLERRAEIGLRRATGASRFRIGLQFLTESGLLGLVGGTFGVVIGVNITAIVSLIQGWVVVLDPLMLAGPALGLGIGMLAGVYPSLKAARADPAAALRS